MGASSSSLRSAEGADIFISPELNTGSRHLSSEENTRTAFLNFIKSGAWLDSIVRAHPIYKKDTMSREERLAFENKNPIYLYKAAPGKHIDFRGILSSAGKSGVWLASPRGSLLGSLSSDGPSIGGGGTRKQSIENIANTAQPSWTDYGGCYVSLENFGYFCQTELISIMFGILYPIFLKIPNKEEYLKCGTEYNEIEEYDDDEEKDQPKPNSKAIEETCVLTKSSRRAQECLLSCAANFDESHLYQHLKIADWVDVIAEAFGNHPMPITVSDVNRPGHPFVYVNKSFASLVGESAASLRKKGLGMLTGPDTEALLTDQVQDAQEARSACKVAITHYGAGKKSFLNLLALKPSGGYMFAVHCPANRASLKEDLQIVDDLLLMLGYVVKAPPAARLKRGQSWVPSLANLRDMSRRMSRRVLVIG